MPLDHGRPCDLQHQFRQLSFMLEVLLQGNPANMTD